MTEKFIGPHKIKKIENAVKLELPELMKIHLVVHIYRIVLCQKCYNSNSLLKLEFKKKPCIRINTRELDKKTLYKIIYLIYPRLVVYITLPLAYPK